VMAGDNVREHASQLAELGVRETLDRPERASGRVIYPAGNALDMAAPARRSLPGADGGEDYGSSSRQRCPCEPNWK
jgi:hypothetical protein